MVPQSLFDIRTLCRKYFNGEPLVVGEDGVDIGLKVNITRPEQAGADRLVNAIAAHSAYPGNLIIIDFGTATTFDIVSSSGDFEGGIIVPGVNLSLQALHDAAAKLPHIAVRRPDAVIGKDTETAMLSGIYWGYIGLDRRTGQPHQGRIWCADDGNRHGRAWPFAASRHAGD